ncbi:apses-domain-containing protein [Mucor ambiguus]|uniref:Apses-domain-containing protein n=1 Tax=Mucor ambiguus TaxID=91626 RepID=A0A0C9MFH6_9FUNG|nr:apses-domain-containing protein [Mucor ambiguus]
MSAGKVYSAVYSGVQVYEMMIHGIATMVRGEDSYLNATQILKVAGFEKTRRSKILEREVLIGEHEKVQGGYGKYQGTWIPFEKGKELAEKYEVLDRMMPLLNFDPNQLSSSEEIPTKEEAQLQAKKENNRTSTSPSMTPLALPAPPQTSSQSSTTPTTSNNNSNSNSKRKQSSSSAQSRKKLKLTGVSPEPVLVDDAFYEHHRSLLMNLFLSDDPNATPSLAALLTKDINIDLVIDEQGHTALHWAAALGRLHIVSLLIEHGANVCRVNYKGETPLMRAAMITCCYENKNFAEMVEIMADAIPVTDQRGRTVLHHIALTAAVEGYTDAAIYYMKRLVKGVPKKSILKNILNIRDTHYYESALAIALRVECQDIVDILIKHGALDPLMTGIDEDEEVDFEPIEYETNPKGKEIKNSLQYMIDKLEEDYIEKLKKRDAEAHALKKEMNMLKYELREAHRRLELPVSMQLAEARKKIHQLQDKVAYDETTIGDLRIEQQETIDASEDPTDKSTKERKLEKKLRTLQNQLESGNKTIEKLQAELAAEKARANEKEMEYRRLIAASCGLPIERVDGLIKPLTLAIESDPPDLDMARVIGFMERLRRQGNNTNSTGSNSNVNSPRDPNTATTPV